MKMMLTRPERLALLLHLMGEEATEMARQDLSGEALEELDQALKDFQSYPPSQEEIDMVLGDFEDYFHMALQTLPKNAPDEDEEPEPEEGPKILQIAEESFDVEIEPTKRFTPPKLTGDTVRDLNQMHPYQVAQALKNENPVAAAIVLRKLANEHAAKTLEFLPEAVRPNVFLELAQPSSVSSLIQERILAKALQLSLQVEERETEQETTSQMANLMRSLPRALRKPMLDELEKRDSELAETVRNQLYRFEDIEKLADRDLQKLLGQCQTDALVCALQQVDESLLTFVLSNMSKRAKESLQEEMEFKTNASEEEITEARGAIAKILAGLCEAGEVKID
ncbi:FliG C-terminal domain-containing protein [Rhodopirellula sp. JC639]|uniref:FliG C-terminal domain-containing protein n=1 Tax=Stieleria mannarensis TaxID=2755585 RepID=UPI001601425D|nr:FliG C-terminal domain-containing protein [Rhodopirellula sp. JC639]